MLDQFERNKFFLSNIFFYSVGRDILIIKESSQNSPLHYKFYPHSLQYIYIYTLERLHAIIRGCIVQVGTS